MRHLRSKLYLLSIILCLLCASSWAQNIGGGIGLFNTLEVNDSSFNYGFARHFYGGAGSAYRMNYTGSGGLLFDYQVNGASVFLLTGTGNINHLGPFTTYMLGLKDTDRTHALVQKWNENDSADRALNWFVVGANRSVTLEGNTILDQDLSSDSIPNFNSIELRLTIITDADTPFELLHEAHLICDTTNSAITVNLPAAATVAGRMYWIKNSGAVANNVTIDANGSELIDEVLTVTLIDKEALTIVSDGSNWHVM